jgi:hypothetical protein
MRLLFVLWGVFLLPELFLYLCDLVFALVGLQHLIHLQECLFKSQLIVLFDVVFVDFELMDEMLADKDGDFSP